MAGVTTDSELSSERDTLGAIIEAMLASLPADVAYAARLSAIPHWCDEELLSRLTLSQATIAATLATLVEIRYLERDDAGTFHCPISIRGYFLDWWLGHRDDFADKNRIALEYFSNRTEWTGPAQLSSFGREVLYHLVIQDELEGSQNGLIFLSKHFEEACDRYQYGTAEDYLARFEERCETFDEKRGFWQRYYRARLELIFDKEGRGLDEFNALVIEAKDQTLINLAHWSIGEIYLREDRWSEAISELEMSLKGVKPDPASTFIPRVMVSMGDVYLDLAKNSGGYRQREEMEYGRFNRFLDSLQHLPFLGLEWLLHRVSWLPNFWYFGTSYQDWIIANLLVQATGWYRRAEKQFEALSDNLGLVKVGLQKADAEFAMGRWSRSLQTYTRLASQEAVMSSRYRTARVLMGVGCILQAQGNPAEALPLVQWAADSFDVFSDQRLMGWAALQLGRIHSGLGSIQAAGEAYMRSLVAYQAAEDGLMLTQVQWEAEELAEKQGERLVELASYAGAIEERQYITRFPESLLLRFQRLALLVALPVSYLLTLIVGLAIGYSLIAAEAWLLLTFAGMDTAELGLVNILILVLGIVLPLPLALWLYRFVYSLIGMLFVRYLGRELGSIEKDSPEIISTNREGVTLRQQNKKGGRTLRWVEIGKQASLDTLLWQRPIQLISRQKFSDGGDERMTLNGITYGYERLKADLEHRAGIEARRINLDFTVLGSRLSVLALVFAVLFAVILVFQGEQFSITAQYGTRTINLYLSPIFLLSLLTVYFIFPVVVLWRLIAYRRRLRKELEHRGRAAPDWVLWLATICATLIALVYLLLVAFLKTGQG